MSAVRFVQCYEFSDNVENVGDLLYTTLPRVMATEICWKM